MAATPPNKVAFVGLGTMGFPMAGHLQTAGYATTVFNRTTERAVNWCAKFGGRYGIDPADAATDADVVMVCVGNDDDVRSVVLGDTGVLGTMKAGSTLIDHTTCSAELARELGRHCNDRGVAFLDAPVSGGQAGAENGQLTIMVGGDQATVGHALPVLEVYAKKVQRMGPVGAGQLTKMVNQICIAGLLQGLSEALHFAECAGLDTDAVVAAIGQGAAQSWQMDNRWQTMRDGHYDHGFAVDWMRKDLRIALDTARQTGATLPVAALVDQFYADVQAKGGGRWDTSSLLARLGHGPETE